MGIIDRRRVGGALARFFARGSGPSHSDITSALMACGYHEPDEDAAQTKQDRINQAFRKTNDPEMRNLLEEILLILRNRGSLDDQAGFEYDGLISALEYAGLSLDDGGFIVEIASDAIDIMNANLLDGPTSSEIVGNSVLPDSNQELAMTSDDRRIFISHAEADADTAQRVARFLQNTCRLPKEQILCTSAPGYGLSAGEEWIESLRLAIQDAKIVVFLFSTAFLSSDFCGFELGAAWMIKNEQQRFPIMLPDIRAEQLRTLPGSWHCPKISEETLGSLIDRVVQLCGVEQPRASNITSEVQHFFRDLT